MNHSCLKRILFGLLLTGNHLCAQEIIPFTDSTHVNAYYILRGAIVKNFTDTLWLLNKQSFEKYRSAHSLLFPSWENADQIILQMDQRDTLVRKLYEERKQAYDALYALNEQFYHTSEQYIQQTKDTLDRMNGQIFTIKGQLDRANQNLDTAVEYIKSAKKDRYRYLIIGLLAGGIIGYILN